MSITCSQCSHTNPSDSLFCNHCGQELKSPIDCSLTDQEAISEAGKRIYEEFSRELKEEASALNYEMLETFKEKATNWAKSQFILATSAISIVVVILGYLGFKGFDASAKFTQLAEQSTSEFEETRKKFAESSSDALSELKVQKDAFDKKFKAQLKDLEKFNTDQILEYETRLKETVATVEKLKKQTGSHLRQAASQLEEIKKLENSRFRILVHYRDTTQQIFRKNIALVESALFKNGFIIDEGNISNVTADREEILYFSNSKHIVDKVREIQQSLSEDFKKIPINYESTGGIDPLQVIIKLCPQDNAGGSPCIVEPSAEN